MATVPPDKRNYTHEKCGTITVISGGDFASISDPFNACRGTFCVGCSDHFPLDEFVWDDTGETIADARERLRSRTPGWVRVANGQPGCFAATFGGIATGAAIGAGLATAVGVMVWIGLTVGGCFGLIAGVMLVGSIIGPWVRTTYFGVEDYRELK
jgi:hypothetical protein